MVQIAIAGGSSAIAREVIDVLVATKKHSIKVLSRRDAASDADTGIFYGTTDYRDSQELAKELYGVHTVLSFIDPNLDKGGASQKVLIEACVFAGVKRFAPSEWSSSSLDHMPWYESKGIIREYLKELNETEKVLEYTLFQSGLLANYFAYPHNTTKHLSVFQLPFDFNDRRALVVDGYENARITLITVQDLAQVVAHAVVFEGEWPLIGGIKGAELSMSEVVALDEKIRGAPFSVEKLKYTDLESGELHSSWIPQAVHPSTPPEKRDFVAGIATRGCLLAFSVEAFNVTDEWNRLLPDVHLTSAEEFLTAAWEGKP